MATDEYSPADVSVLFNGAVITGFAAGTFINIERNGEGRTMNKGADGGTLYVKSADKSGQATLTLQQNSDSNRILGGFEAAGTQGMFIIKDNLGFTTFSADAVVKRPANRPYDGGDGSSREWVILLPEVEDKYPTGTTPAS